MRRTLLRLTMLFFAILLLEVEIGHQAALGAHAGLALLPVVWLGLSLLALIAFDLAPSDLTLRCAEVAMVVAALVGVAGFFAHLAASGVTLHDVDRVFSPQVWGGPACPNWPIAITVAAIVGFLTVRLPGGDALMNPVNAVLGALASAAIVAGIVLSAIPGALAASADGLVLACVLLLAVVLGDIVTALLVRRNS